MEDNQSVSFSKEEMNQIIRLLDITVKQVGISDGGELANNAIYFANKISSAFNLKE